METSFKENNFLLFPSIIQTIEGCKSLVTYFKQSSLYCRLEKSLEQESESRWNSKLEMLESISDQFEMIYDLLTEKDQLERVEIIDITIVEILINFLKRFCEASECLEASKYPTIILYFLGIKLF